MKILIVDDNADIIKMLKRRLKKTGYEVLTAANGREGIEKIREINPDLTLMDMHMPVMDGYQAVRRLRTELGYTGKIAALTASAATFDVQRSIEAGCDFFIPKPIENDFIDRLQHILESKGSQAKDGDG
jgi:two-component system response regulator MprA